MLEMIKLEAIPAVNINAMMNNMEGVIGALE